MAFAFGFFIWTLLSITVGTFANNRGRNAFGWLVLSLTLSPLVSWLILLVLPDVKAKALPR